MSGLFGDLNPLEHMIAMITADLEADLPEIAPITMATLLEQHRAELAKPVVLVHPDSWARLQAVLGRADRPRRRHRGVVEGIHVVPSAHVRPDVLYIFREGRDPDGPVVL